MIEQWTDKGIILLDENHPLVKMSDEEFALAIDDPYWQLVAEVMYAAVTGTDKASRRTADNDGNIEDASEHPGTD